MRSIVGIGSRGRASCGENIPFARFGTRELPNLRSAEEGYTVPSRLEASAFS